MLKQDEARLSAKYANGDENFKVDLTSSLPDLKKTYENTKKIN
jgi:hypothetical protein